MGNDASHVKRTTPHNHKETQSKMMVYIFIVCSVPVVNDDDCYQSNDAYDVDTLDVVSKSVE